jgi:hypothetical protein
MPFSLGETKAIYPWHPAALGLTLINQQANVYCTCNCSPIHSATPVEIVPWWALKSPAEEGAFLFSSLEHGPIY